MRKEILFCLLTITLFLTLGTGSAAVAQKTFYINSSEFHWARGGLPLVIQPRLSRQLSDNSFIAVADSSKADYMIRIKSHSYYQGQTELFFFALLDANFSIYDKVNGRQIYSGEVKRIKGGGTSQDLADTKVFSNGAVIVADTITRFLYHHVTGKNLSTSKTRPEFEILCDADRNIPENPPSRKNTYVLIIANDAYSPMQMARCFSDSADYHARDARVFREYAILTLGIPAENIQIIINAKSFEMRKELIRLATLSKGIEGKAELIFYYAGYGLIDEKTLEPYILPVDIENDNPKFIVKISDLYKMLQEETSKRVTIILETTFQYDALKPKPDKNKVPKIQLRYPNVPSNLILMAAAAPGQKAWSDNKACHGLFTLSLLNNLKETQGNIGLKQLADSLIRDVRTSSAGMKLKEQVPQVLYGSSLTKSIHTTKL